MDHFERFLTLLERGKFLEAALQTIHYVSIAVLIGGLVGLAIGTLLVVTRKGGVLANRAVYGALNTLVNFMRPIPFVILIAVLQPLTRAVVGKGIGEAAFIFTLVFACAFGISRLVEQSLLTVEPGSIEAARAAGAGPWRIIFTVLIPEGLAPLVLGYTFAVIAVVDMSAMAGLIGAGGLGTFAMKEGYQTFNQYITWGALIIVIIIVQAIQIFGNLLARKIRRH
ncbi:MAG: methionine ABC transporter permease [Microbacteriaceae bacterium]|nr:methionine ABC transporter permease [Microbacteriaceae bacterium]